MFKKSSRSKNIRKKIETIDDNESSTIEQEEDIVVKKTVTSTEKKKKKEVKKSVFNPLSFGDEEEQGDGEEFQIKKIKTSRKIKLQLPDNLNPLSDEMEVDTTSNSHYKSDYLETLKKDTLNLSASVKSVINSSDALLHEKFPSTMNAKIDNVGIPDANAILAAKKKREQMRKGFTVVDNDDGFISLGDGNDELESNGGSRLIREEDDLADDGEAEFEKYIGDKLNLNKGASKVIEKERKEGVREMIEEAEGDEDQSEDMERWEEDMMKYGGAKTRHNEHDPYATPANYRPANVPEPSTLPTLSDIIGSLTQATSELSTSMKDHESHLQESLKTIENADVTKSDITKEIERTSNRYIYFQELYQYVNDLGEFLDAKFPELKKLESEVHDTITTKTEIATERRWQNNLDDLELFMTLSTFDLDVNMDEPEVDEFGRVKELRNSESSRNRRRAERNQRIAAQVDFLDLAGEDAIKEQGLWTDDEMQEEYYEKKDEKLDDIQTNQIDTLLSDVGEEFRSLESVKDKFEAWKLEYNDDYQKAFGSLSLPGAFEFYIRCELVSWDPFSDPREFDSMNWHSILSSYGVSEDHEDPDTEMMNKIVEKTIIKKIEEMLDTLNVASLRQMRYASQAVEQISYYVDTQEKPFKDLATNVIEVLERQIIRFTDVIEGAIPKSNLDNLSMEAKHRFFWSQCKYFKTLAAWRRYLPKEQLDRLGSSLMNRVIAPILKPDTYPEDAQLQDHALFMLKELRK